MELLNEFVSLEGFFEEVERADRSVLLLDYDGTLAPFCSDRDNAFPYSGVRERLAGILDQGTTRLMIISGRPVADVKRLLDLDQLIEIWGTHGGEQLAADGTYYGPDLSPGTRDLLEDAAAVVGDELEAPERCERKPASVAFHVRDIPSGQAEREMKQVREEWQSLIDDRAAAVEPFDGGLELRLEGYDKGAAVESILEQTSPDQPVAYLGDDLTDEDAFAVLDARGLRVLVRDEFRETRADIWLVPPDELLEFLDRWAERTA